MSLKAEGYRYYVSPDNQLANWIKPELKAAMYPDWIDVTDWSDHALAELLMSE